MKSRRRVSHLGTVGLILALAGGCASSPGESQATGTATSAPSATQAPSIALVPTAVPTPTPAASPTKLASPQWPYASSWEINDVLFADDGRLVLVESHWSAGEGRITVLDKDGVPVAGWPWTPGPTGDAALGVAFGPDGSLYVVARGHPWSLHRLTADSREMAGFPLDLPDVPFCDLKVTEGAAVVSCGDEEIGTGAATPAVTVVEPDGSARDGWPVAVAIGSKIVGFGPDGRVYLQSWGTPFTITALARDGTTISGWPHDSHFGDLVQIDPLGRVSVTNRSDITAQCGLPARTTYTLLLPDGTTAAGWPVTVKGWSSDPVINADGSIVVASPNDVVTTYTAQGELKDGWPVRKVGVTMACSDGSKPVAAGDGATVIVGDGRATLLDAGGRIAPGWPVTLPYNEAGSVEGCTPGPCAPHPPAVGTRAVYVGGYSEDHEPLVMVIDRDGSSPKAAQVVIGKPDDWLSWIRIAPTGRVWAVTRSDEENNGGTLHLVAEDAVPNP